ncbi:hypothetical protein tb265_19780 [Gemmatimonadetes bacterium T265]|nr:hypothetical protein tb265_19780 [Gemmatimonadetes bacterium T265]
MPSPGASVRPRYCAACGAALSAGANYCHRCGTAVVAASDTSAAGGRTRGRSLGEIAPWAVAFVAFLALAAMAAGRNLGASRGGGLDAPQNALPQASLGEGVAPAAGGPDAGGAAAGGAPVAPFAGAGGGRAPDLSTMTPRDIADRLFDRVMRLSGEGKIDSAQFFATMALQNYGRMPQAGVPLDNDLRYDMGRIAEVAGRGEVAAAQADTILRNNPTHLLGLVLAIKGAALQGDRARLADAQRRLIAAAPAERAKNLEEYQRHGNDIDAALKLATATGPVAPR